MKTYPKFFATALLAVACSICLGVSAARADDDEQGGDIEGNEDLEVEVQMTPTSAAPAGSSIDLKLQAEDEDGQTQAELELDEKGLPAGTYTVSATLKSNGSTVQIGTFTIASGVSEAEIQFSSENDQGENEDDGDEIEGTFPANVNPFDIATVSVSNSSGVVLFTADLTKVTTTSATLSANLTGKPGPTDPGATGNAVLTATAAHSKPTGSLQINGQGLPLSTALNVTINGMASNVKRASTTNMGTVSLMITPKRKAGTVASGVNLLQIKKATLSDKGGNVLLNFSF
jgi:hypothetical protein